MRFIRDYRLTVGQGGTALVIEPPFSIVFKATKTQDETTNKLDLRVFNLANPQQILKAQRDNEYVPCELAIGYADGIDVIFRGNVDTGKMGRSGADAYVDLTVLDGGKAMLEGYTSATVRGKGEAFDTLLGGLPDMQRGTVANLPEITRPRVLVGNSASLMTSISDPDQRFFIDGEHAHILGRKDVRDGTAPLVDASTGLLDTPESDEDKATVETILNPAVKLGGLIKLESVTAPDLNGVYKVEALTYNGDTDGDDWNQTLECIAAEDYEVPNGG